MIFFSFLGLILHAEERLFKSHLRHEAMNKEKTEEFKRDRDSHIRITNTFEVVISDIYCIN